MKFTVSRSLRFSLLALVSCGVVACVGEETVDLGSSGAPLTDATARAVEVARVHFESDASVLPARSANVTLAQRAVTLDKLDQAHIRYDQLYKGVRVFEGQAIAHVDVAQDRIARVTDALLPIASDLDIAPAMGEEDALFLGRSDARAERDTEARAELMVFVSRDDGGAHLAYRIHITGDTARGPVDQVSFIDAHSGATLLSYDNLHTGKPGGGGGTGTGVGQAGTAKTLYSGNAPVTAEILSDGTFGLKDVTRGGLSATNMGSRQSGSGSLFIDADNIWGNNTNADAATVGSEALFGAAATWDYYAINHGRNGIFDDGQGALSRVHYGRNYNNAFWSDSCKCMTYGDGDGSVFTPFVSLDVAGHEMTHGVTSATADLTYSGESGGLNEAMSDIFGTMVEFHAASLAGVTKTPNYLVGEDIYRPSVAGDALRYMDAPRKDGRSIDHFSQYTSGLDVHYSSGLANNAFFLLAEGGTNQTSGKAVTGIGRTKAAAIFYRALTVYMTPGTTFAGARQATLNAAADLYGAGGAEAASVASTWTACGVN
jgi:zinc metalloprotease ZmpA